MRIQYSYQYQVNCVVIEDNDTARDIIDFAKENEAVYYDGEDDCIVVDFCAPSRVVGPELYTESALIRSLQKSGIKERLG